LSLEDFRDPLNQLGSMQSRAGLPCRSDSKFLNNERANQYTPICQY
jgi:hypothetical protein